MAFVLEGLTDEQRIANGLALISDVRGLNQRCGLKYVSVWAIDKKSDVYLVITNKQYTWYGEMHWKNNTIPFKSFARMGDDISEALRYEKEKEIGKHITVFFEVCEILIPEKLQGNLVEIKNLIISGLSFYALGMPNYKDHGYAEFSPNLEIRFPKITKSEIKLSDFATIQ